MNVYEYLVYECTRVHGIRLPESSGGVTLWSSSLNTEVLQIDTALGHECARVIDRSLQFIEAVGKGDPDLAQEVLAIGIGKCLRIADSGRGISSKDSLLSTPRARLSQLVEKWRRLSTDTLYVRAGKELSAEVAAAVVNHLDNCADELERVLSETDGEGL